MNELLEVLWQSWLFVAGTTAIIGSLVVATVLYEERLPALPRPALRESYIDEDEDDSSL